MVHGPLGPPASPDRFGPTEPLTCQSHEAIVVHVDSGKDHSRREVVAGEVPHQLVSLDGGNVFLGAEGGQTEGVVPVGSLVYEVSGPDFTAGSVFHRLQFKIY